MVCLTVILFSTMKRGRRLHESIGTSCSDIAQMVQKPVPFEYACLNANNVCGTNNVLQVFQIGRAIHLVRVLKGTVDLERKKEKRMKSVSF